MILFKSIGMDDFINRKLLNNIVSSILEDHCISTLPSFQHSNKKRKIYEYRLQNS